MAHHMKVANKHLHSRYMAHEINTERFSKKLFGGLIGSIIILYFYANHLNFTFDHNLINV